MTIELRTRDRLRARLGLPRYPKVDIPGVRLRHDPQNAVLDPYGPAWLWRHDSWPAWQWFHLPVEPHRAQSFDDVESLLRAAITRRDMGFYLSLHGAGRKGGLRSP